MAANRRIRNSAKRFVIGTKEEIKKEQEHENLEQRFNALEAEFEELRAQQDQSFVAVPDKVEIEKYGHNK